MKSQEPFPFPYSNPGVEGASVLVIRHGERMDEVYEHAETWRNSCVQKYHNCENTFYCRHNDPPLTENGKLQAVEVAQALKQELLDAPEKPQVIFSSKLIRSLMTAYEIAKELSLPICVSSGLAMTAAAVRDARMIIEDEYSFLSIEEMRSLCPGVELIDGDKGVFQAPENIEEGGDDEQPCSIPCKNWEKALHFMCNWKFSVVVAHRESLRMLSEEELLLHIPYCAYGIFKFQMKTNDLGSRRLTPQLTKLSDRSGEQISFATSTTTNNVNNVKGKSNQDECSIS